MKNSMNKPTMISRGGPSGGSSMNIVSGYSNAAFDVTTASIGITVDQVLMGSAAAVSDVINVVNPNAIDGSTEKTYAGVLGTYIMAFKAADNLWYPLDIAATVCCTDSGSGGPVEP